MAKQTMTARQQHILALVKRYQRLMGLADWHIDVVFCAEKEGAACSADDEYLQAIVHFDTTVLKPADDAEVVRHELAHCLTWELLRVAEHLAKGNEIALEMIRAASERCTTLVERMPVWRQS